MAAVGDKQREERIFRIQILIHTLRAVRHAFHDGDALCTDLHRLRNRIRNRAHILHMMSRICLVQTVHLHPAIGDCPIVILVQEHAAVCRTFLNIAIGITSPREGLPQLPRCRHEITNLLLRQWNDAVCQRPGTLQITGCAGKHFLRTVRWSCIAQQQLIHSVHRFRRFLAFACGKHSRAVKAILPRLFHLGLAPAQKFRQLYAQIVPQQRLIFALRHLERAHFIRLNVLLLSGSVQAIRQLLRILFQKLRGLLAARLQLRLIAPARFRKQRIRGLSCLLLLPGTDTQLVRPRKQCRSRALLRIYR